MISSEVVIPAAMSFGVSQADRFGSVVASSTGFVIVLEIGTTLIACMGIESMQWLVGSLSVRLVKGDICGASKGSTVVLVGTLSHVVWLRVVDTFLGWLDGDAGETIVGTLAS